MIEFEKGARETSRRSEIYIKKPII